MPCGRSRRARRGSSFRTMVGARSIRCRPAIDVLPAIATAVAGRALLLLDGGIRRGTDVLKALALGASAVLIGRPIVYGLAVNGAFGVRARAANSARRVRERRWRSRGCRTRSRISTTAGSGNGPETNKAAPALTPEPCFRKLKTKLAINPREAARTARRSNTRRSNT